MVHIKIPNCPRCNSFKTGRFIPYSGRDKNKLISNHLRKGEIVFPVDTLVVPRLNLYCEDCGLEWAGDLTKIKINKQELETICEEKEIHDEFVKYVNETSFYRGELLGYSYQENDGKKSKKKSKIVAFGKKIMLSQIAKTKNKITKEVQETFYKKGV